jgi:hypothetical protein
MVDFLIAFESFDKLLSHIGVHPDEIVIVKVIFSVEKLEVEVPVGQSGNNRVLCFEHHSQNGRFVFLSREIFECNDQRFAADRTCECIGCLCEINVFEIFVEAVQVMRVLQFHVGG